MKKPFLTLKIISLCVICVTAILLGYFAGTQISNNFFAIDKYAGLSKEFLLEDVSTINYEGKTPDMLCATDAYIVAIHVLHNQENYTRENKGELKTSVGVTQYIHSISGKTGSLHFQEIMAFSSLIKRAGKFSYEKGGTIRYFNGTPSGDTLDAVSWSDDYKDYTYEEYSELLGRNPDDESTYIVSSKTSLEASTCTVEGDKYTFTITLDPTLASLSYVNEIAFISDIDVKTINFTKIIVEFTTDKNFKLIDQKNIETYSMKYSGIPVTINSEYNITFTY